MRLLAGWQVDMAERVLSSAFKTLALARLQDGTPVGGGSSSSSSSTGPATGRPVGTSTGGLPLPMADQAPCPRGFSAGSPHLSGSRAQRPAAASSSTPRPSSPALLPQLNSEQLLSSTNTAGTSLQRRGTPRSV